jgi:NAD(P)H-hydrate epimerase
LGTTSDAADVLQTILQTAVSPLVIDADAINIMAAYPSMLDMLPEDSILTPHPKEFDRLTGSACRTSFERRQKALLFAAERNVIVVLKGAYTAICLPNGHTIFNPTGNPGMATAGSGDVLTGIILSLLAQNYTPKEAAVAGTYIHGLAGDLAAAEYGQNSMIAGDIIRMLGKAFRN